MTIRLISYGPMSFRQNFRSSVSISIVFQLYIFEYLEIVHRHYCILTYCVLTLNSKNIEITLKSIKCRLKYYVEGKVYNREIYNKENEN